ncbi:MAG: glyoxalase [Rhodobacterales bacterium]|nr:MAG: glyoxalase [Rhodobacterales bacterium]
MTERDFEIAGLGEIAIRCADMEAMKAFYGDLLGLKPLSGNSNPDIQFFRIAEGVAGHTAVLALFHQPGHVLVPGSSSLHHLALSLPYAGQEAAIEWFERQGVTYRIENFDWVGWRGVFVKDPEGNTVELVAFDPGHADH